MVRKLIGNKVGVSGIYEPDDNVSLVNNLNDLTRYVYDEKTTPIIPGNVFAVTDLYISPDETKIYTIDSTTDSIVQNSLSNGYISADYNNLKSFLVSSQESSPTGVFIGAAGTAMYIVGSGSDAIFQYTLGTAYDLSTASYSGISFSVNARETAPTDIDFSDDGTKVYIIGQSAAGAGVTVGAEYVHQFNLGTPWTINTASYSSSFYVTTQTSTLPSGVVVGNGGTSMYVNNPNTVYEYTLATPWEVNTASYTNKSFTNGQESGTTSIYFHTDGTKFYIVGTGSDAIFQYSLGTPWDISTASYDTEFFYVGTQDTTPSGLYLSPDGTNVYMVGTSILRVNQYPLTTPWDIKTVNITPSLFIGLLESFPSSLYLKPDGTSVYILGSTGDRISEIPLNTPWDIRTAGIGSIGTYPVVGQDTAPQGVYIGAAGTAMYMVGSTSDAIYQYTLGTAYDLNTASYSGISSNISARETAPADIDFSDDGTKIYIIGQTATGAGVVATGEYVHQFDLSSAWNVGTAGYSTSFYVTAQTGASPTGVVVGNGGTSMYVNNASVVYEYTLATPWEVNTASYTNKSFSVGGQEGNTQSIYFHTDGTKFYIVGSGGDAIFQYSLGTPWDISTASYDNKTLYVGAHETVPTGLYLSPDGTSVYMVGSGFDRVVRYPLSTAWDISTWVASFSISSQETNPTALYFKSDGTKVYILGQSNDTIFQYSLSTPWDLTTTSYDSKSFNISQFELVPTGLHFSNDGSKVYVVGSTNDRVHVFRLTTPWDISTAINPYNIKSFSVNAQDTGPQGVFIGAAGTAMYMVGSSSDTIYQYTLGTAYDVSAASYSGISFSISARETVPTDIDFSDDGTKVYIIGQNATGAGVTAGAEYVHQFNLGTPWTINTASYSSSFYVTTQTGVGPTGLVVGNGGTSMYVNNASTVFEYTLATPWEVNTASYTNKSFVVSGQESGTASIYFHTDGTKFYIVGSGNDTIYQYSLGTPWDISTASYDNKSLIIQPQEVTPTGLYLSPDGTSVYVVGSSSDRVFSYDLDLPWEVASYNKSLNVVGQETNPQGVQLNDDLSELYIVGSTRLNSYHFVP
jgi:sugar lactone lactonase YvrE